jgi:ArsR family transcriptional regulator
MKDTLKILKALADPTRLRIISLLLRRDLCVCELMFILKMEQSRISHQLRILRDADLVEDKREGIKPERTWACS